MSVTIETNGPPCEGIDNEDGFRELGVRLENIEFDGTVFMSKEQLTNLWSGQPTFRTLL